MSFFLAHAPDGDDLFGAPAPSVGARVVFDAELLFIARERLLGPVTRELTGDEGLVVHEDPRDVLTWPCRLWRVGDLEGVVCLLPENTWVRCMALTVLEELPPWLVMGARGDAVVDLIKQARGLSADQVNALAAMPGDVEGHLYREAWDRWLVSGDSRNPIGCGLSVVANAVETGARGTDRRLFGWDEADEVEVLADPAWQQAGKAAFAAALAFGAPQILDAEDNERLAWRWTSVIGRPRGGR